MFSNPNSLFTIDHGNNARRDSTQVLMGKIVDTTGDGGVWDRLLTTYSVYVPGWNVTIPNCKQAAAEAGYNGTGTYKPLKKNDIVFGLAKEGCLEDFIILGTVRLNGKYSEFINKGQALRPGEVVANALGSAPTNQASIHPARLTKLNNVSEFTGINTLQSAYDDPLFYDTLEESAKADQQIGIIHTKGDGGDVLTYSYGSHIIYTDANNIIVSNGSTENKCTRMLETAKKHCAQAALLQNGSSANNASNTSPLPTAPQSWSSNVTNTFLSVFNVKIHPLPVSYRITELLGLAAKMMETAQDCNQQAATMQEQTAQMNSSFGNSIAGSTAIPTPANPGFKPGQTTSPVNAANQSSRNAGNDKNAKIFAAAVASKGASSAAGPDNGRIACVWAINNVLAAAGVENPWNNVQGVLTAEDYLKKGAGTKISDSSLAIPGDIVMCSSSFANAHIGIYLGNGRVISNSSSRASFSWESGLNLGGGYGSNCRIWRIN